MALAYSAPHELNISQLELPPTTENYVPSLERGREQTFDNYTVLPAEFRVSDYSTYPVRIFRPRRTEQFEHAVAYTTPWCTDLEGFNMLAGEVLATLGMNVVAIGPESPTVGQAIRNLGHVSLRQDAVNQHMLLDTIHDEGLLDTSSMLLTGYSRGAMIAFGMMASAESFGRSVKYTDAVDPCLAKEVTLKDISWQDIPAYYWSEVGALFTSLANHPPHKLGYMVKNAIPLSIPFWIQQIGTGKALFSGEAGTFVREWPEDATGHITLYSGSKFNHMDEWAKLFGPYNNISVHPEDGHHLSGANSHVISAVVARMLHAQRVLACGGTGADITNEFTYNEQLRVVSFK